MENELNHIDFILTNSMDIKKPNESVKIYQGKFLLSTINDEKHQIQGKISFVWHPSNRATFQGKIKATGRKLLELQISQEPYKIYINKQLIGKCLITKTVHSNIKIPAKIEGIFIDEVVLGDKSVPVSKITFLVPNLISISGTSIKQKVGTKISLQNNRTVLVENNFKITIDKMIDYSDRLKSVQSRGGFICQYIGEISSNKLNQSITWESTRELLQCLSYFLSFVNGRRTSPIFTQGIFEASVIWTDYSAKQIDPYQISQTWYSDLVKMDITNMWSEFRQLWRSEKEMLTTAIHWYIEANDTSQYAETTIIISQTAMELFYNYLVVEKAQIIKGDDTKSISASNKIRLLLFYISIAPDNIEKLKQNHTFLSNNKQIEDVVDLIVFIRNSIVHSNEDKRTVLYNLPIDVIIFCRKSCLKYIELCILYLLKYKGKFKDRVSDPIIEKQVPWTS